MGFHFLVGFHDGVHLGLQSFLVVFHLSAGIPSFAAIL
jgi:hypothetical protein